MFSSRKLYVQGAASGLFAEVIALGSGFVSAWLVNQFLSKEGYGDYALAVTFIAFATTVATGGLDRGLLYRLSQSVEPPGTLHGREIFAKFLLAVLILGAVVSAGIALAATSLASALGKPGLGQWLLLLALLVPLDVMQATYGAWLRACQRVTEAVSINRIALPILRLGIVVCVWMVFPTERGLANGLVLASFLIVLSWIVRYPVNPFRGAARVERADWTYSGGLLLSSTLNMGLRQIDLILVGALTASAITAEYAIASRLAPVSMFVSNALNAILAPRIARLLLAGQRAGLEKEYRVVRLFSVLGGLGAIAGFLVMGERILAIFGDYQGAHGILIILLAGFLIQVSPGPNGLYLQMRGRSNLVLAFTTLSIVINVVAILILVPILGALGAALGTAASIALVNALISVAIWRTDGMATYSFFLLISTASACAALIIFAFGQLSFAYVLGVLTSAAFIVIFSERDVVRLVGERMGLFRSQ